MNKEFCKTKFIVTHQKRMSNSMFKAEFSTEEDAADHFEWLCLNYANYDISLFRRVIESRTELVYNFARM